MNDASFLSQFSEEDLDDLKWSEVPEKFVVFDTETTGLTPSTDRILEIGAVLFLKQDYRKTGEISTFQIFIKQDSPIPKEASAINGITDEMVKDGESDYAALTKFFEFVGSNEVYAYNAKFDKDFISATAKRSGYFDEDFKFKPLDILAPAREHFLDLPNHRLTTVSKSIGMGETGAHRAVNDSVLALNVFIHIQQKKAMSILAEAAEEVAAMRELTKKLQEEIDEVEEKNEKSKKGFFNW